MKARLLFYLFLVLVAGRSFAQGDGSLDPTYGANGRVQLPLTDFDFSGFYLALDSKERAVVCGSVSAAFFAARLLPNGQPDATFGGGGVAVGVAEDNLAQDAQAALALPGNRTLIVVNAYGQDSIDETRLIVLNEAGQIDTTFGNGGIARFDFNPGLGEEYFSSAVLLPDAKILLVGYTVSSTTDNPRGIVVRLNPDGSLDATFANNGRYEAPTLLFISLFSRAAVQPDGKIVLIGATLDLATQNLIGLLLRLNSDGQPDVTFGTAGVLRLSALSSQLNFPVDIAPTSDGKWVIFGTDFPTFEKSSVARLNANGGIDNAFGSNGVFELPSSGFVSLIPARCLVAPDGRILAIVTAIIDTTRATSLLARITKEGQLDTSFGDGGVVSEPVNHFPADMALQADGKILVSGIYEELGEDFGAFVYRYSNTVVSTRAEMLFSEQVQVNPNPIRDRAAVQFDLDAPKRLQIELVDASGRTCAVISSLRQWEAGPHTVMFSLPEQLSAGWYGLRFCDEAGQTQIKAVLVVPR